MLLREAAQTLYALPLDEFTPRRNALAKELRARDRELAEAVRRLPKPGAAAWAVNLFARRRERELRQLLDLGAQLRESQQELAGDGLRDLTAQAGPLVRQVTREARRLAEEEAVSLSGMAVRQVEQTLRAAMADEEAAEAVRAGLLTRPLRAVGFGAVDVTAAVALQPRSRSTSAPARRGRPRGRAREEARRAAKAALREVEQAENDLALRTERHEDASAALREARLEKLGDRS